MLPKRIDAPVPAINANLGENNANMLQGSSKLRILKSELKFELVNEQ
jgi:hypothetical protein